MKKILIFIDSLGSGGAQRRAINIANLLCKRNYCVSILTYHNEIFYDYEISNLPIHCIKDKNKFKRIIKIIEFLKKADIDVVISFMESPNFIACFSKLIGCKWKLITTESSAKDASFKGKKRWLNNLERVTDYKICNSVNAMNLWIKKCHFIREKIGIIYNPVIIGNVDCSTQNNKNDNKFRIIVAASYQNLKNPQGLVRAVSKLSEEDKKRLMIDWFGRIEPVPGNRDAYDEAMHLIRENNLEQCINLHSETKKIYEKIYESDAVGLFSKVEGLPNAICEGMMLKKAIVMSRVSDYNVLINGNGFLCDANDIDSITKAIHKLINTDEGLIKRMGNKSGELARSLFSPEAVIKQWIKVIEDI